MDAYNHGIRSAASDRWATGANNNWITEAAMFSYFWSGSTVSNGTANAWLVNLGNGLTSNGNTKYISYGVVCVRP
jgi:hypothetical protein